jgi:hypothetical protein
LKVLRHKEYYQIGVSLSRSKFRHDVITAVLGLLRARYDLAEKVYYHHAKCSADALLEKAIRTASIDVPWREVFEKSLGDDTLLKQISDNPTVSASPAAKLFDDLQARRLPKNVYRLRRGHDYASLTREMVRRCTTPSGRSEVESEIAAHSSVDKNAIIVSCLPEDMQLKQAMALVEWPDGDIVLLKELPDRKHYLHEVTHLTSRYRDLWSLTVYLSPDLDRSVGVVEAACERLFGRTNDALLAKYIRERYRVPFSVSEEIELIGHRAGVRAVQSLNVASGGGDPSKEPDPNEVAVDALTSVVDELRPEKPRDRKSKRQRGETSLPIEGEIPEGSS